MIAPHGAASPSLPRSRRRASTFAALAVIAALAACDKSKGASSPGGAMNDSPFVSLIPADAPYAFASFQPVPARYWESIAPMLKGLGDLAKSEGTGEGKEMLTAILDELGPKFDSKRAEELGFTLNARWAVYAGVGAYPVIRTELASGDKLYATIERIATRAKKTLPKALEKDGHRYWAFGDDELKGVVAIGAKELVFAFAPSDRLDKMLPVILGAERPAKAISSDVFRDIAKRHGYSGFGVGFADNVRIADMVMTVADVAPACRTAITDVIKRAPRTTFGYGDLNQPVMDFGVIVELAPDLIPDVKAIGTRTPDATALGGSDPLFAMSVALDVNKARALGGRLGQALSGVAEACQSDDLREMATGLGQIAVAPLPPAITNIHGAMIAVHDLTMQADSPPTAVDGFAVLWTDDAPGLLAMAAGMVPQVAALDLRPDGKAKEVMPGALPFPVSASMRSNGIAVFAGQTGAKGAEAALSGKPAPAPLLMLSYDYGKLFDWVAKMGVEKDAKQAQLFKDLGKTFGSLRMDATVDDRGVVLWSKLTWR